MGGILLASALGLSSGVAPAAGIAVDPFSAALERDRVTVRTKGLTARQVAALSNALVESRGRLPGGAIAGLWVPGRGMWVGAVGQADIAERVPMRPGLQIPIGSVTKTVTGTLVLQEVQRGRLRLDDPLAKWFPNFPKADEITVAMLLNMSSGIADFVNENFPKRSLQQRLHPHRVWKPAVMIRGAAAMPRHFDVPGSQYAYSNTNTVILGQILAKVTGKPVGRLMQRRLFEPLGMDRTKLDLRGRPDAPYAQTYSLLYGEVHGRPPLLKTTGWSLSLEGAAGAVTSTLADLRRWVKVLGTGSGVLSRAMQRERLSRCTQISSGNGATTAYCLGAVVIRDERSGDVISVWHNGRILGATGYVAYYPRTKAVLVVQCNQDGTSAESGAIVPDTMAGLVAQATPELVGLAQ